MNGWKDADYFAMLPQRCKEGGAMQLESLFVGLPCLASGLVMFLFPRRKRLAAEIRIATRKNQLAAGDPERYFEEGRALDAYPPPTTDAKWRIRGALLIALGVALPVMSYFR